MCAMGDKFVSCDLRDIRVSEPLPVSVYIYIDFRFITFRPEGAVLDRTAYDRLEFKRVKNLFVLQTDWQKFEKWSKGPMESGEKQDAEKDSPQIKRFKKVREEVQRRAMDIFQSENPNKVVVQTVQASKKLVLEVMKVPYATKTLAQLQTYSRGTVDHSVNVSVLSVYLAMQMGYTHNLILQHLGTGALLHDIGKPRVHLDDDDTPEIIEKKMMDHPTLGLRLLESQTGVANEVKLIIAQHHECYDGSGYPKKTRGHQIYDLARIVAIANVFDQLVSEGKGTLAERQKAAVMQLDQTLYKLFDPQKLEKALKILKLGL